MLPLAPRLVAGVAAAAVFHWGVACGGAGALVFAAAEHPGLWAFGYCLCGAGLALRWIVADGLIAALSPPEKRGRIVGLFETLIGATPAAGPFLPAFTGASGPLPFWIGVGIAVAAAAFCFFIDVPAEAAGRGKTPPGARDFMRMLAAAPLGPAPAPAGGMVEGAGLKLFPVMALEAGYDEAMAAAAVGAMGAGNILTQYPVGRLTERLSPGVGAAGALAAMCLFALATPFAAAAGPYRLFAAPAGIGGASGALYTLAVIRAGSPLDAVGMIAGVGVVYTAGSVVGPAAGGFALTAAPLLGLPLLPAASSAAALIAVAALKKH